MLLWHNIAVTIHFSLNTFCSIAASSYWPVCVQVLIRHNANLLELLPLSEITVWIQDISGSFHVLSVHLWVLSRYSGFLSQTKNMLSKLFPIVSERKDDCLSLCGPAMSCDLFRVHPASCIVAAWQTHVRHLWPGKEKEKRKVKKRANKKKRKWMHWKKHKGRINTFKSSANFRNLLHK